MKLESHPLIKQALTHRSLATIEKVDSNEMLEFLGDRVLDLLVTEMILQEFPRMHEGTATKVRTTVCNTESVAAFCRMMGWDELLRLPRAPKSQAYRKDLKVQADTFEAVIGAWYQVYGLDYVAQKIGGQLRRRIRSAAGSGDWYDGKVEVNDLAQKLGKVARYRVERLRKGGFEAVVSLDVIVYGKARGQTEKMAEQAAARKAVKAIRQKHDEELDRVAS